MKKLWLAAILLPGFFAWKTATKNNIEKYSHRPSNDGWITLFNGKDLSKWHSYGHSNVVGGWKIENGAIHLDPKSKKEGEGGDLTTNDEFDNYDLKLEWKISPKGNSGIIFFIHEDTTQYHQTYSTGPEMQVVDNEGHPDGHIIKHKAGDLYDLISSSKEAQKPVGEWNAVEIKSLNGKLDLYLNGVNVVSTTMWDNNWKQLIANSKFATWPGFGTYKKGKISLQDHGDEVWYRNVKIKKLS